MLNIMIPAKGGKGSVVYIMLSDDTLWHTTHQPLPGAKAKSIILPFLTKFPQNVPGLSRSRFGISTPDRMYSEL